MPDQDWTLWTVDTGQGRGGGTAWAAGPLPPLEATTTLKNKKVDLSHYFLYKTEKAIVKEE